MSSIAGTLANYDPTSRSVDIIASTTNAVEGVALTSWDLSRFEKNPAILWAHDASAMPIGLASNVVFDPLIGLTMTVTFADEETNAFAERVARGVAAGLIRAVSVGFTEEGDTNVLDEVSFVSLGLDEDAGTSHVDPDHPINDEVLNADAEVSACQCACTVKRGPSGALESTDACSCFRALGFRVDEHGDPKAVVEACTPKARTDAGDASGVVFAREAPGWKPVTKWRLDATRDVPVLLEHDHDPVTHSIGRAVLHLDSNGDVRAAIRFASDRRSKTALAGVRSGVLRGLSPRVAHYPDGTRIVHVVVCRADESRSPQHRIDTNTEGQIMNYDARKRALTTGGDDLEATAKSVAKAQADRAAAEAKNPSGDARVGSLPKTGEQRTRAKGTALELSAEEGGEVTEKRTKRGPVRQHRDFRRAQCGDRSIRDSEVRAIRRDLCGGSAATLTAMSADAFRSALITVRNRRAAEPRTDAVIDSLDVDALKKRRDEIARDAWKVGTTAVATRTDAIDVADASARLERARVDRDRRAYSIGRGGR